MKTIIVKTAGNTGEVSAFIKKLEKYTDHQIENAVICTRYLGRDNYNTIAGELKDAVALNDYDLFIIGVIDTEIADVATLQALNRAHTFVCTVDDYDSAKNYVIID